MSNPAQSHELASAAQQTDDLRIVKSKPLETPATILAEQAANREDTAFVAEARNAVQESLFGSSRRLLVVAGPCSIHDEAAALEYADRLRAQADRFADDLLIVMRVYFEKPRTTVGWKGYINDPDLDGSFNINKGLKLARKLLLEVTRRKIPAGTEFLDTISPQYVADLVSWGAIGARTVESQIHRELASGLSMPIGFKNGTKGTVDIAVEAITAAKSPHCFLGVTKDGRSSILETLGNASCHVILRGAKNAPNFASEHVQRTAEALRKASLPAAVMVDCSHGNSDKKHKNQLLVAKNIAEQIAQGETAITGVMLESHLVEGNQEPNPDRAKLTYGQSITDACLHWDDTVVALEMLAEASAARRRLLA